MAAKTSDNTCCRLEGKLFTGVQLERIFERSGDFQSDSSYNVPLGQSLKEEVARSYRIASNAYLQFKRALDNPSYSNEVKREATRQFARALFSSALGYNLPKLVERIEVEEGHLQNKHVLTFPVAMLLDQEEALNLSTEHHSQTNTTNITPLQGSDGQRVSAIIPLTVVYAGLDPKTNQRSTLDSISDECAISDSAQPKKQARRSPFAMTQELLNTSSDYLWGFAFNGFSLRLLRDVMSFARPSFVEFDLEAIFEGDNQAEFSHLYLMLHSSRARVESVSGLNIWEEWLKLCAQEGIPAREQLSASMQEAMQCLGTGFLRAKGKGNDILRAKIANHELSAADYNHQLMRLMYRFLFVFCLEERGIIHTRYTEESIQQQITALQAQDLKKKLQQERSARTASAMVIDENQQPSTVDLFANAEPNDTNVSPIGFTFGAVAWPEDHSNNMPRGGGTGLLSDRQRVLQPYAHACKLYDEGYSLRRLRDQALLQRLYTNHHDIWLSVKVVFKALAQGEELLALPALGGLFNPDQCPDLMADEVNLSNADLLHAMKLMRWANLQGVFTVIDYRNVDTEELGSLYEGLLELVPTINYLNNADRFTYTFEYLQSNANERKSTGSYYTPDSLVKSLIHTALDPVIDQKLKDNPSAPESALLSLKVIDPACGSGHFLLAAARRIAVRIMEQKSYLSVSEEVEYRKTLHDVISHCIYGVDLNPMSVELARMALWLEGAAENKPLSFIDHHLKVGNSLLGVMDLDVLKLGIPADAYTPQKPIGKGEGALTLSDKTVCSTLKKRNTQERKVFSQNVIDTGLGTLGSVGLNLAHYGYKNIDELSADTIKAEERKAKQNERNQKAIEDSVVFKACNLLLAAFLSEKTQATQHLVPTTKDLDLLMTDPEDYAQSHQDILDHAAKVCAENNVMHWPFAFMEVMAQGGFDCVLGNPPWEKPKVEDIKWFASRLPEVADAKTAAIRKKMIEALSSSEDEFERKTFEEYVKAQYQAAAFSTINHLSDEDGGRFPLTGVGDTNLFAYFAEHALNIKDDLGSVGMVVPTGIVLDDATKRFTQEIFTHDQVSSVYHFNNTEGLFAAVASNYSFMLLTLRMRVQGEAADCVFYATNPAQLEDEKRHLSFEPSDIELINPNTRTLILVRSEYDLELCRKLYKAAPVLVREGADDTNTWHMQNMRMFDMANDSDLFNSLNQEQAANASEQGLVPLYEGKLFWQFDHRSASFGYNDCGSLTDVHDAELELKRDQSFKIIPRYWVRQAQVKERWAYKGWNCGWTLAWRKIARSIDERTLIVSVLPTSIGAGDSVTMLMPSVDAKIAACLLATLNSLVVDFILRLKQASANVSVFYLKQLPILPPEAFAPADVEFIASRVAMLTRTADDINAVWLTEYPEYTFQEPRERLKIRAELDAYIAKMYGLTREELRYILDPSDVMGPDHPSVTFPGLKKKETELYSEYLTQRLVLEAYDKLVSGVLK